MAERGQPSRCPGHRRHWFTLHGTPGARAPVCVRCGAVNPKPLKPPEWVELEGMVDQNWRVGRHVFVAVQEHRGVEVDREDGRAAG